VKKSVKRVILALAILVAIGFGLLLFLIIGIEYYLPHQKITIRVPYDLAHPPDAMNPMGETIYHPVKPGQPHPYGHPGIDYEWLNEQVDIISSSDGWVVSITEDKFERGHYDISVKSGAYLLNYKEIDDVNPRLHIGSRVHKGDKLAKVGKFTEHGQTHYNIHWEFASVATAKDRWCPLMYFEPDSLASIQAAWIRSPENSLKTQFPEICSAEYKDYDEYHGPKKW
jgi:hypothetical protein